MSSTSENPPRLPSIISPDSRLLKRTGNFKARPPFDLTVGNSSNGVPSSIPPILSNSRLLSPIGNSRSQNSLRNGQSKHKKSKKGDIIRQIDIIDPIGNSRSQNSLRDGESKHKKSENWYDIRQIDISCPIDPIDPNCPYELSECVNNLFEKYRTKIEELYKEKEGTSVIGMIASLLRIGVGMEISPTNTLVDIHTKESILKTLGEIKFENEYPDCDICSRSSIHLEGCPYRYALWRIALMIKHICDAICQLNKFIQNIPLLTGMSLTDTFNNPLYKIENITDRLKYIYTKFNIDIQEFGNIPGRIQTYITNEKQYIDVSYISRHDIHRHDSVHSQGPSVNLKKIIEIYGKRISPEGEGGNLNRTCRRRRSKKKMLRKGAPP